MSSKLTRLMIWSALSIPCFWFMGYVCWVFRSLGDIFVSPAKFSETEWKNTLKKSPPNHYAQLSLLMGMDRDRSLRGKTPEEAEQILGLTKANLRDDFRPVRIVYRVNDITIQLYLEDGKITKSTSCTPGPENY